MNTSELLQVLCKSNSFGGFTILKFLVPQFCYCLRILRCITKHYASMTSDSIQIDYQTVEWRSRSSDDSYEEYALRTLGFASNRHDKYQLLFKVNPAEPWNGIENTKSTLTCAYNAAIQIFYHLFRYFSVLITNNYVCDKCFIFILV